MWPLSELPPPPPRLDDIDMVSAGVFDAVVTIDELLDFLESVRGSRNRFEDDDFADHMEAVSLSCATEDERRVVAFRNRSETPKVKEFLLEWMDDGRGTSTWKFDRGREFAETRGQEETVILT